jgi:hypothetical protein
MAAPTKRVEMLFNGKLLLLTGKSIGSATTSSGMIGFIAMAKFDKKTACLV